MFQASPEYADALRLSHQIVSRAVILIGGQPMDDTFYQRKYVDLITNDSSISEDRSAATRGTCQLSFRWLDDRANEILDPLIFPEVAMFSGLMINGVPEWLPMGVFGITDRNQQRTGNTVITRVSGLDRSDRIRTNPWADPYQVAKGTDYFQAAKAIVVDRAKGFTTEYNFGSNALTTPASTFSAESDPWDAVMKLAEAVGCETFFDRQGGWVMHSIPDPTTTAPSLEMRSDIYGVIIPPVTTEENNRDVYNGVIVRGEAPWLLFPISGEVWDDDPSSPTWRGGTFGEKPLKIGDAIATTDAQCLAAAQAQFNKVKGVVQNITFSLIKDARLTVGDTIYLYDERLSLTGRYVLDTLNFPFGNQPMTGTIRRRR